MLKADLKIDVHIASERGVLPGVEVENAYWKIIQEQFVNGRRFTLHVYQPHFPRWYNVQLRQQEFFAAQFKIWPALKRGMIINPRDQEPRPHLHWSSFVPPGTPEYDAIKAANGLAIWWHESQLKPKDELAQLHEDLFGKIAQVPK